MAGQRPNTRKRGNIEEHGDALRVRRATVDGTDDKAWRKAEDKLAQASP
jgi:hypothetical protein